MLCCMSYHSARRISAVSYKHWPLRDGYQSANIIHLSSFLRAFSSACWAIIKPKSKSNMLDCNSSWSVLWFGTTFCTASYIPCYFHIGINEQLQQVSRSFTDHKSTFLCSPVSVCPEVVFTQLGKVESLLNWDWLTLRSCEEKVYRVGDKETGTVCLLVSKAIISGLRSCKGALLWSHCVCCLCVCMCLLPVLLSHTQWSVR